MPAPTLLPPSLGQKIRRARIKGGLTQLAMARLMGYQSKGAAGQICKLENSHQEPSLRKLLKIANVLGIEMEKLIPTPDYGQPIKAAREARGLTQLELAHVLGLKGDDAGAWISRLERGQYSPRVSTLQRIATALGVPVEKLLVVKAEGGRK